MKKILAVGILLSGLACAQEDAQHTERLKVMHGLESAMTLIQKGFLRNQIAVVKLGTETLKDNLKDITHFVIEPSVLDENFNAQAYASTESSAMSKLADQIQADFESGNKNEARVKFDQTVSRCLACHKIIRKW